MHVGPGEFPSPNPYFPDPPRPGQFRWGWLTLLFFGLALASIIAIPQLDQQRTLREIVTYAGGGCILLGIITACLHVRRTGWRKGPILPAVVRKVGEFNVGDKVVSDGVVPKDMVVVETYFKGRRRMLVAPAQELRGKLAPGELLWIVMPAVGNQAQFIRICAPRKFRDVPVPQQAREWLSRRLDGL